jgi:PEGA domain
MQSTFLTLTIVLPLLVCGPAIAAPRPADAAVDSSSGDQADVLFHKGKAAFDAGKADDAYALYQSAWAIKQTHDIAGNLAQAEIKLGKTRDAAEHLAFALAHFPPSVQSERRDGLKKVLDGLRQQVGVVHIKVNVVDAKISIDGRVLRATQPLGEAFVGVGTHTVVAELAGYSNATKTVQASAGSSQDVELTLMKVEPLGNTAPKPPVVVSGPSPILVIVSGAFAAGGLAAGAALTVTANGKTDEITRLSARVPGRSACVGAGAPSTCMDLRTAAGSQDTLGNGAAVSFLVGGAFALATAGFGIWAATTPSKATASVRVVPVVAVGQGGVMISGAW